MDAETGSCEWTGIRKTTEICSSNKTNYASYFAHQWANVVSSVSAVLCWKVTFVHICRYIISIGPYAQKTKQNKNKLLFSVTLSVFSECVMHWKCVHWLCDDTQRPQTRWCQKQRGASSTGHWLHRPVLHLHQKVTSCDICREVT